ncbi:hypothetical protein K2173_017934 [Erythroxylum novogranatense]|uniref:Uncharacterized protein n=1 Tax=Erythroxylum novogranatense TaxID=1862640 RepID=A0AAV8TUI8_9ROSI|nr:hypothetical protein K2173_017934 [Erythroxylum novogranatense]
MVGGSRKDEAVVINNTNVFAALSSLRRKKKKDSGSHMPTVGGKKSKEKEEGVFWAPAPLTVKSWADVDDEDDDDYYATTAPPTSVWGSAQSDPNLGKEAVDESETEEEGLDEVDDDIEEEHEDEYEHKTSERVEAIKKPAEAYVGRKDTERQLSKKELKKKGLEELDAVLAELGYAKREISGDNSHEKDCKAEDNGELQKRESAAGESKCGKKKKKKEKTSKEPKDFQDQPQGFDAGHKVKETAGTEKTEDVSTIDVKERLKKAIATKKKKSSKEMDAAARVAASEAAARAAKLAAAKKKEKSHYNQQPVR